LFLKSTLSALYLHVSSRSMSNGHPVFHTDSTTMGSQWLVQCADEPLCSMVMLKNLRSGFYLHVADEKKSSGDPVVQRDSTSDGSKWQVEYVAPESSMIRLKSVRSGLYLQATPKSKRTCCDAVLQIDSVTDGSTWEIVVEAPSAASATGAATVTANGNGNSIASGSANDAANGDVAGYYAWSWSSDGVGPDDTNMGICFNGYEDVDTAISECTNVASSATWPATWLSIGGNGDPHGTITPDVLSSAASSGDTILAAGYDGVIFDVEVVVGTNDALVSGFTSASQALTSKGLKVGVTTSHSGPTGVTGGADAATLVKGWVADPNMALLSPQLYTTGQEDTPEFVTTATCSDCTWELWQGSIGAFAPSIVTASQYEEVQTYFSSDHGITTQGYIQWQQSPSSAPVAGNFCGSDFSGASACSQSCPGGMDSECLDGQACFGDVSCSA